MRDALRAALYLVGVFGLSFFVNAVVWWIYQTVLHGVFHAPSLTFWQMYGLAFLLQTIVRVLRHS